MTDLKFVWDAAKSRSNHKKHGVRFEEAATAFRDENAKVYFDPDHSDQEERFILLGLSFQLRVLVVCHCYREARLVVRIISARKANRGEQEAYWS
ncbi:MAG: BrnT family toxin [Planctomycetes bacterium]|nr:BrnT family toxin [Planctomycetota bacterium]